MRNFGLLFQRDLLERIRRPAFWILTVIGALGIVVVLLLPFISQKLAGPPSNSIAIVADDEMAPKFVAGLAAAGIETQVLTSEPAEKLLRDKKVVGIVTVTSSDQALPRTEITVRPTADAKAPSRLVNAVEATILRLAIPGQQLEAVRGSIDVTALKPDGRAASDAKKQQTFVFLLLLYMAPLQFGGYVAGSVAEEKHGRLTEVLLLSFTPFQQISARIAAFGVLAAFEIGVWLTAALGVNFLTRQFADLGEAGLELPSAGELSFFALVAMLSYIIYAALNAGLASVISKTEDIGGAVMPLNLLLLFSYLAGVLTIGIEDSAALEVLSFCPPVSGFVMFTRVYLYPVDTWEIVAAIGGLVAFGVAATLLASRLYRNSLLYYGNSPSLKLVLGLLRAGKTTSSVERG